VVWKRVENGYPLVNEKSSTFTVCPLLVTLTSACPLVDEMPLIVTLVQPVLAGMATDLSAPPKFLIASVAPAPLL